MKNNTVVSVFGFDPYRIGAGEIFARELSEQLAARGWTSVLCFLKPPPEPVRRFLDLPNVAIEIVEDSWQLSGKATARLFAVLRKHRPRILHLYFTGFPDRGKRPVADPANPFRLVADFDFAQRLALLGIDDRDRAVIGFGDE